MGGEDEEISTEEKEQAERLVRFSAEMVSYAAVAEASKVIMEKSGNLYANESPTTLLTLFEDLYKVIITALTTQQEKMQREFEEYKERLRNAQRAAEVEGGVVGGAGSPIPASFSSIFDITDDDEVS